MRTEPNRRRTENDQKWWRLLLILRIIVCLINVINSQWLNFARIHLRCVIHLLTTENREQLEISKSKQSLYARVSSFVSYSSSYSFSDVSLSVLDLPSSTGFANTKESTDQKICKCFEKAGTLKIMFESKTHSERRQNPNSHWNMNLTNEKMIWRFFSGGGVCKLFSEKKTRNKQKLIK